MSLCCIGGVCIPYSALVPLLVYGLQWILNKLASWGLLPATVHEKLQRFIALPPKTKQQQQEEEKKQKPDCCTTASNSTVSDATTTTATAAAAVAADGVITIESDEEWTALLESSNEFVVCKFTASWCQPCHKIQPFYESLAETNQNKAAFCLVDVDEMDEVAADFQVAMMPTFLILQKGKEVARYAGSHEEKLREFVEQNVS